MEHNDNSLSTDAVPMAPIPTTDAQNTEPQNTTVETNGHDTNAGDDSTTTHEDFDELPNPPADWQFNNFLDEIAEGITMEEFEKMKHLFRGQGGIGKGALEKIQTPLDFFAILRTRTYLNRDNLIYLQQMLRRVGRMDLIKLAVEYAKSIGNVIHFYPASTQPENGFKFVKFHVEGRNFRNSTRKYVQHIRNQIAAILFVPAEFIIIAGIEPSSSLLITLMIPELYVTILTEMLEAGDYPIELKDLSIDIVEIQDAGKLYNVRGIIDAEVVETEQQEKLTNIYQQLEQRTKQLDDSEIERLRLTKEHELAKSKISDLKRLKFVDDVTVTTLKKMFVSSADGTRPATLASQSALKEFQTALIHADIHSYDKRVLQTLISANTDVVTNRMRESRMIREQQLELAIQELQSQVSPLLLELQKYKFFSEIDISEMDRLLLESFQKLFQAYKVSVEVQLTEQGLQILKKISRGLRYREKEKLARKYTWGPDEELKQTMDTDQSFFLAGILYKELKEAKQGVDIERFVSSCLLEVGRTDLNKKFLELAKSTNKNASHSHARRNSSQRGRSRSLQRKDDKENNQQQGEQVQVMNKMADQVQKIYDVIQDTQKSYASQFGPTKHFEPPPYSRHDAFDYRL